MAPGQQSINQRVSNHPFYKNNVRKDKAWHLIAVVLGVEGEYIRFRIIAGSRVNTAGSQGSVALP